MLRLPLLLCLDAAIALAPPPRSTLVMRSAPRALATMASPPPPVSKGYYARPSAAVEQGGSFYVPGLEGSNLRLSAAALLSVGLVLNRVFSPGEAASSPEEAAWCDEARALASSGEEEEAWYWEGASGGSIGEARSSRGSLWRAWRSSLTSCTASPTALT